MHIILCMLWLGNPVTGIGLTPDDNMEGKASMST